MHTAPSERHENASGFSVILSVAFFFLMTIARDGQRRSRRVIILSDFLFLLREPSFLHFRGTVTESGEKPRSRARFRSHTFHFDAIPSARQKSIITHRLVEELLR